MDIAFALKATKNSFVNGVRVKMEMSETSMYK